MKISFWNFVLVFTVIAMPFVFTAVVGNNRFLTLKRQLAESRQEFKSYKGLNCICHSKNEKDIDSVILEWAAEGLPLTLCDDCKARMSNEEHNALNDAVDVIRNNFIRLHNEKADENNAERVNRRNELLKQLLKK